MRAAFSQLVQLQFASNDSPTVSYHILRSIGLEAIMQVHDIARVMGGSFILDRSLTNPAELRREIP
jgi:hypothetical protein